MSPPFDWSQELLDRECDTTSAQFASLIDDAEHSLRYADDAGSTVATDCLWGAHGDLSQARHLVTCGCAFFLVTDAATRCGEAASAGGMRGIAETRVQLRRLQEMARCGA